MEFIALVWFSKFMSIQAFVDNGYPEGREYCIAFLSSPEFKRETLLKLMSLSLSNRAVKRDLALQINTRLENNQISDRDILLAYVKQSRTWLSIKRGQHTQNPSLMQPEQLFTRFGDEGWYGPIQDPDSSRKWYIRTHRVVGHIIRGTGEASEVDEYSIRWSVVAEIDRDYVALSSDNFSYTEEGWENRDRTSQFPFWIHVPQFFEELSQNCRSSWTHPVLHELILNDVWYKYLPDSIYRWRHLRIRAESSGVALNAHSAGVSEINVEGLQALSKTLAESALKALDLRDQTKINSVENALLHTLIKEWGTKSYEFSLEKAPEKSINGEHDGEIAQKSPKFNKVFKAHCYFGLKPDSRTQDAFQHLRCYDGGYGGSTQVLNFVLRELGLRG